MDYLTLLLYTLTIRKEIAMRYAHDVFYSNCRFDTMDYSVAVAQVAEEKRVVRKTHSKDEVTQLFVQLGYMKGGRK